MPNLLAIPSFADADAFHVVIESPRGSTLKLKYDAEHHVLTLSRPLPVGLAYPYDWGFVPSTRGPDGDPLDAFVMWDGISYPGLVLSCRALGVLRVEQRNSSSGERERNDRVAVLPSNAPRYEDIQSVSDLGSRVRAEVERFFLAAAAFEGKAQEILGWAGPDEARALIRSKAHQIAL